jgi:hypothetical protein
VLAVEGLTGGRPFPGNDPGELLAAMALGPRMDPGAVGSERVATALRRCLAYDPAARLASVESLQAELIPALQEVAAAAAVGP